MAKKKAKPKKRPKPVKTKKRTKKKATARPLITGEARGVDSSGEDQAQELPKEESSPTQNEIDSQETNIADEVQGEM
jgi:hypothetical protein